MVFAPRFADLDSEREVVLEEIAMVEDTPQDLVHDLLAEAVFGDHPLGRPVIGTARRDLVRQPARARRLPPPDVRGRQHRARGGRQPRPRPPRAAPRAGGSASARAARARARASGSRSCKPPPPGLRFQRKDTEQYHVCVGAPGISRSDRRRFAASLLDAILGGSASSRLFQEIREKRGMAYAVYSFASQYSDTGSRRLRRDARGEPRRVPRDRARADRGHRRRQRAPSELERAKENLKGRIMLSMESTSNRMSRLGKSLITDTELLSLDRIIAEIDAVDAGRGRRARGVLLAPEQLSAAGIGPSEERFRAAVERVNPGCPPAPRREGRLFGRGGKVGSVLAPALEAAGHELVDGLDAPTRWSTSPRRTPSSANIDGCARARRPVRRRHDRLGHGRVDAQARARPGCPSSSRRTSRSAPC